jgi:hypothetical protein
MSIKSDNWIRRMVAQMGMIEPFEPNQVRSAENGRIISYGTSSYGYDVRCANEFKIFTNINSTIVDPKKFDEKSFVDVQAEVCIIPPNSFALARTVEYFRIPRSVLTICLGKSTYARCFSGDTRVALVDGSAPTLEEMARRHENGELFWGYSIDASGRVIVAGLEAPRFIGRDSLLEIELDTGERIRATPDHPFMRRDVVPRSYTSLSITRLSIREPGAGNFLPSPARVNRLTSVVMERRVLPGITEWRSCAIFQVSTTPTASPSRSTATSRSRPGSSSTTAGSS